MRILYRSETVESKENKMDLFNKIYSKHYDTVFKYTLVSLNNNIDLANDCMQDIASLALKKLDTVINHPNPGGFLIVTAKNYIQKHKALIQKNNKLTVSFDETMTNVAYEEDFDRIFEERVNIDKLKEEILCELNSAEIGLYCLFYEKKLSVRQTAQNLKISESNVKVRLFRLRVKVRKMVSAILSK